MCLKTNSGCTKDISWGGKIALDFYPLLQWGLYAISWAQPTVCPDRFGVPTYSPKPVHRLLLLFPDHNRQILQQLVPREISMESFTHLLSLPCPLLHLCFPPLYLSTLCLPPFLNYSSAVAGTGPELRKSSHPQRFTSSISTMGMWVPVYITILSLQCFCIPNTIQIWSKFYCGYICSWRESSIYSDVCLFSNEFYWQRIF